MSIHRALTILALFVAMIISSIIYLTQGVALNGSWFITVLCGITMVALALTAQKQEK